MKHIIVGTAGHVDHGKTALIKALSGFEGDTTVEEKKRGITIDLSFSNLQSADTNISFIDVPGHEKLIKNMIAGAFGFDASMLVVDANEGLMPQTNEHLEILNLLGVCHIIVVLSKSDLASETLIKQRKDELSKHLEQFKNLDLLEIVVTSIHEQESIETLKKLLLTLLPRKKRENGLFRYYIDRSFSIKGAGVVVTGTVLDGKINVGDRISVAQLDTQVQIRNIQVHDSDVKTAFSSQRAALNLQSSKLTPKRGDLLTQKGYLRGFYTIDAWCESTSGNEIQHNSTSILYIGTKQIEVKVLLYGNEEKIEKGFVKLRFKEKMYCVFDEPFVITHSGRVIAGGHVTNPIDEPMKNRLKLPLLQTLKTKEFKESFTQLISTHKHGFGLISSNQRFGLNHDEALAIAKELENIFIDEKGLVLYPLYIKEELKKSIEEIYHKNKHALLSAKSLSLKIKWASEVLLESILKEMVKEEVLIFDNGVYRNEGVIIDDITTITIQNIYTILSEGGITPQAPYNIYDSLFLDRRMGDNALKNLTSSKKVMRLAHNLFVTYENLQSLMSKLKEIIDNEGYIEIQNFKTHFPDLSRKYLIAYLEYLDNQSGIKKEGNRRIL